MGFVLHPTSFLVKLNRCEAILHCPVFCFTFLLLLNKFLQTVYMLKNKTNILFIVTIMWDIHVDMKIEVLSVNKCKVLNCTCICKAVEDKVDMNKKT